MKLIVLMAFDTGENGDMVPAFDAREMRDADIAVRKGRELAQHHAGVIVWQREAQPDTGDYGEPETLFQAGEVPDLD